MGRAACLLLVLCLCFGLCGCDLWMNGSYSRVTPHKMPSEAPEAEYIEVSSYNTLYLALCQLVESARTEATVYYPKENKLTVQNYMDTAIRLVCTANPIGSYAVDKITYQVGTKGGVQAVAVRISYDRSISDIRNMKKVEEPAQGESLIYGALNNCAPSATFFVENYSQTDLVQLVNSYVDANPDVCMEMPLVTVASYPEDGASRVIEVLFTYQNSRDDLRAMQQTVSASFDSAMLYVSDGASDGEKCAQLYSFLALHYNADNLRTSITPAYSLLHHSVGDSKAYATVYAAMCNKAGVKCSVVVGTKDSKPYYWNVVKQEEGYLFVDVLQCARQDSFVLRPAEQMGNYVWNYSAYQ